MSTSRNTTSDQARSTEASERVVVGDERRGPGGRSGADSGGSAVRGDGGAAARAVAWARCWSTCGPTCARGRWRWGGARPRAQARSLSPVLPERRRPVMVSGPWSVAAVVRLAGMPSVTSTLLPAQPGQALPTLLRIQVGPVTWELADAAAYTSLLNAWRSAADLLAVQGARTTDRDVDNSARPSRQFER